MNAKLIELAEQSGYKEGFRFAKEDLDIEQFAESIIRECIGECEKAYIRGVADGDRKSIDAGYSMELVTDSIKQKFGML
jgi:hypothetical protein